LKKTSIIILFFGTVQYQWAQNNADLSQKYGEEGEKNTMLSNTPKPLHILRRL